MSLFTLRVIRDIEKILIYVNFSFMALSWFVNTSLHLRKPQMLTSV